MAVFFLFLCYEPVLLQVNKLMRLFQYIYSKNDDSEIIEIMNITYLPPSGQVCDSGCLRLISASSNLLARDLKSSATCLLDRVGESSTKELRSQISLLSIEFGFLIL